MISTVHASSIGTTKIRRKRTNAQIALDNNQTFYAVLSTPTTATS